MRCLDRGPAPRNYTNYAEARDDLGERMGFYCAYCEQPVGHRSEVEHVTSQASGGHIARWDNLLLSCRYCNAIKGNSTRPGYLWPDRDNTILAFDYSQGVLHEPEPMPGLSPDVCAAAKKTIELCGLNRVQGSAAPPTMSDNRSILRDSAWKQARRSLRNWHQEPSSALADQIAISASGCGFFSIWIQVFKNIPQVVDAIYREFKNGTYRPAFDMQGNVVKRTPQSIF